MLTVARCRQAAVWTQAGGLAEAVAQHLGAQDRLSGPRSVKRILGESPRTRGMEWNWVHNWACRLAVTGEEHTGAAGVARLEK